MLDVLCPGSNSVDFNMSATDIRKRPQACRYLLQTSVADICRGHVVNTKVGSKDSNVVNNQNGIAFTSANQEPINDEKFWNDLLGDEPSVDGIGI